MRSIGVVTSSRSDYGIYAPILRRINSTSGLRLLLFVTGMHLSPEFGLTVTEIEKDGFDIVERVEILLSSDTAEGNAKSMGLGIIGFSHVFSRVRPDILLVLGDRFEMHAAALTALPFKIPVAHIHGGELSLGAFDDALRHSITKLSHLHFVSTKEYAKRVIRLGEEPWRVTICGAPSLDNIKAINLLSKEEFKTKFGVSMEEGTLLVTYHPVTLEYEQTERQITELLTALDDYRYPLLFTKANADTGGHLINRLIQEFVNNHKTAHIITSLGIQGYFSAMSLSTAMVGNSSSGIIEAASFKLPVVNIGNRQRGRLCGSNVISVGYTQDEIKRGIQQAVSVDFHNSISNIINPYWNSGASDIIIEKLTKVELNEILLYKQFYE